MMFDLRSSPHHIPISSRGPIKRTSHLRPIDLMWHREREREFMGSRCIHMSYEKASTKMSHTYFLGSSLDSKLDIFGYDLACANNYLHWYLQLGCLALIYRHSTPIGIFIITPLTTYKILLFSCGYYTRE